MSYLDDMLPRLGVSQNSSNQSSQYDLQNKDNWTPKGNLTNGRIYLQNTSNGNVVVQGGRGLNQHKHSIVMHPNSEVQFSQSASTPGSSFVRGSEASVQFSQSSRVMSPSLSSIPYSQLLTPSPLPSPDSSFGGESQPNRTNAQFCPPPQAVAPSQLTPGSSFVRVSQPNEVGQLQNNFSPHSHSVTPSQLTPGASFVRVAQPSKVLHSNFSLTPQAVAPSQLTPGASFVRVAQPNKVTQNNVLPTSQLMASMPGPSFQSEAQDLNQHDMTTMSVQVPKETCILCPVQVIQGTLKTHLADFHKITKEVCLKEKGHDKKRENYIMKCYHCWTVFETTVEVRKCRLSHGTFTCDYCDVKVRDRYDMMEHLRKAHAMAVQLPCKHPGCKEVKATKSLLLQHQRRVHKVATQADASMKVQSVCDVCKQSFKSQANLKRHLQRAKNNPSICEVFENPSDSDDSVHDDHDVQESSQKSGEGMV